MIYLTKIRLINWHLFNDLTISLNEHSKINLIAGNNSAGKSTLNDALYFVLSGGDKDNFNVASSGQGDRARNSDRSLYTYIRGKTQDRFIRDKSVDVISYIALEFFNETSKEHFILASYLQSIKNQTEKDVKVKFFYLSKCSITEDEIFYKDKESGTLRNIDDLRDHYNDLFESEEKETRAFRKDFVARKLKIKQDDNHGDNRYYSILKKALSFNRIENINDFFKNYLLDDTTLSDNLKKLQEKFLTYDELNKRAKRIQDQVDSLQEIVNSHEEYLKEENNLKTYEYLQNKLIFKGFLKEIDSLNKNIKQLNEDKRHIELELEKVNDEEQLKVSSKFSIQNDKNYTEYIDLKKELESFKSDLKIVEYDLNHYEETYNNVISLFKENKISFEFIKILKEKPIEEIKLNISKLSDKLSDIKEKYNNEISEKLISFNLLNKEIYSLSRELKSYKENKFEVPNFISRLLNNIEKKCKGYDYSLLIQNIKENDNKIYKNYLPIVEALLKDYKYDLFVEKEIYLKVLNIYKNMINEQDYMKINIILKTNIVSKDKVNENSLINCLNIENNAIFNYVNKYLNEFTFEDFDINNFDFETKKKIINLGGEVIKRGHTYTNYALNNVYLNKPYIDSERVSQYINELEQRINSLNDNKNSLNSKISKLKENLDSINKIDITYLENSYLSFKEYHDIKNEIKKKEKEYDAIKNSNSMILNIDIRLKTLDKEIEELSNKRKELTNLKDNEIEEITNKKRDVDDLSNKVKDLKETLTLFENSPLYINIDENISKAKINDGINIAKYNVEKLTKIVIDKMKKYKLEFNCEYDYSIEAYYRYEEEYFNLRNNALIKANDELSRNKESAHQMFKDDFAGGVYKEISKTKQLIKELNKRLNKENCIFGKERYQIILKETNDKEFSRYNEILFDDDILSASLFSLSKEKDDLLNDLFNIVFSSSKGGDSTALEKYSNYKNYLTFDIEITNIETNTKSMLSSSLKERSGGETQTPFYIILGASFDSIEGEDSTGSGYYNERASVVLFDEAFNNMDKSRCEPLMEFFKQLDVEVFMIMHSDRVNSVFDKVDTCIGISRIKDKCSAYIMSKEDLIDA